MTAGCRKQIQKVGKGPGGRGAATRSRMDTKFNAAAGD